MTIPVTRSDGSLLQLIVDTGAAGAVFFDSRARTLGPNALTFQQASIGQIRRHGTISLECSPTQALGPSVIGKPVPSDLADVADGILGLGGPGFSDFNSHQPSFLYSDQAPKWTHVSVSVPLDLKTGSGSLGFHTRRLRTTIGQSVPVISDYYWAAGADSIALGDRILHAAPKTAIIFDTGSNFFGASRGIAPKIIDAIKKGNCRDPLTMKLTPQSDPVKRDPVTITFGPDSYTLNGDCTDLAIGEIDQSQFGDLANHEVIIVGTRGLLGRTVSLNRQSSSKRGGLYLTLN